LAAALGMTAAMAGACAEERAAVLEASAWSAPTSFDVSQRVLGPAAQPLVALERTGSTVAIAKLGDHKLAFVADEDGAAIRVVDPETLTQLTHHRLDGKPSQLTIGGDGRLWVALRDRSQLVGLELRGDGDARELHEVRRVSTPAEPVGLAASPDGKTLAVSAAWGQELAIFAIPEGRAVASHALAREPHGVAISDDGAYAYVSHTVGSQVSRVPLSGDTEPVALRLAGVDLTPIVRFRGCFMPIGRQGVDFRGGTDNNHHDRKAVQGFAVAITERSVFVPEVLVHRGEATTGGYGTSSSYPTHQPALVQIDTSKIGDEASGEGVSIRVMNKAFLAKQARERFAGGIRRDGCFLPRAAATDRKRGSVLVSCLGTDEVLAFDSERGPLSTSARGRWKVPAGPMGIAVDAEAGTALVWSQFASKLSQLDLPEAPADHAVKKIRYPSTASRPVRSAELAPLPADERQGVALSALAQEGRTIFHGAGDTKISRDGRACASCHPDGRDDGLTWPTPNGPRQTPMLAGRLAEHTAPFGWQGDTKSVSEHLTQTLQRLGGKGLSNHELQALIAYCHEMATPPPKQEQPAAALVRRGEQLFNDQTVGCAVCHTDAGVGSDGSRHGVGSGPELETPSLAFVAGTAPYFHDGRYASLTDLLRDSKGKMGWGAHLGEPDLEALEAYLLTL
jgi:mono/diheme cytochrome c family protein